MSFLSPPTSDYRRRNALNFFGFVTSSVLAIRAFYIFVVAFLAVTWNGVFPLDDAYITLHNARALILGEDPVYGVSPLVGATSPVHLALLSALGLVLPLSTASIAICTASATLYVLALDTAVRKAGATGWIVPVVVSSGMLVGTVPIQLMNGLETGIAMAAVAAMLALYDNKKWFPLLAGLAPFIRPELALLAGPLMLKLCWKQSPRDVFRAGAMAVIVALPWLVWSLAETGLPVSGTMAAKIAFFSENRLTWGLRAQWLGSALRLSMFAPVIMGLVGLAVGPLRWPVFMFVFGVIGVALTLIPGSLGWNDCRYLAPLVPALLVGFAGFSNERLGKILIAAFGVWTIVTGWIGVERLQAERAYTTGELSALRKTVAPLPAGSRILVHDAGMIAWVAPHLRLIDAVGLKTPSSVAWHRRFTLQACQFGRALDGIARSQNVSYVLVLQRPFWRCIGENLAEAGWKLDPLPSSGAYQLFRAIQP